MQVEETSLPGVLLIKPRVFADARGFFKETYHQQKYRDAGIPLEFVQDNLSRSGRGTLRGLHFQRNHPQGKLVQVLRGAVLDIAVDVRRGSPHFGQWVAMELSEENHTQAYVPPGFAHGFVVLSETADFAYKCTDFYHPEDERTLLWNDPAVGVEWPELDSPFLLSEKDRQGTPLEKLDCFP